MMMSDVEIQDALQKGELVIAGFDPKSLEGSSYDAHLGTQALVSNRDNLINVQADQSVTLQPGEFALFITHERFEMPPNIAAHIGMRSSLARQGLVLLAGMQIDPTFKGHLRLGYYNASQRRIVVDYMDSICTIEFHKLQTAARKVMPEYPELQAGRIPSDDRAYLRQIETTSLSDLSKRLQELTTNVSSLTRDVSTLTKVTYAVIVGVGLTLLGAILNLIFK